MYHVYILRCADGALYIGHTSDLDQRFARHDEGTACAFTALPQRRPVTLVLSEAYASRSVAVRREQQLKRWTRAKKEALIAGDLLALKQL